MAVHPSVRAEFQPLPTLAEDLRAHPVRLKPDYSESRPRLLFSGEDRAVLRQRAKNKQGYVSYLRGATLRVQTLMPEFLEAVL